MTDHVEPSVETGSFLKQSSEELPSAQNKCNQETQVKAFEIVTCVVVYIADVKKLTLI